MYTTRLVAKNPSKRTGRVKIQIEIEFKYTEKKERIYISTLESVLHKNWSAGKISKSENNAVEIKRRIDLKHEEVKETLFKLKNECGIVNAQILKQELYNSSMPTKDLVEYLNEFIKIKELTSKAKLVEKLVAIRNQLIEFTSIQNVYLTDINQKFVNELTHYWQYERKLQPNTISKNFKFLMQLFNYLKVEGVLTNDKYKRLSYPKGIATNAIALTKEEVKCLQEYEPKTQSLRRIKDLFLVLIYSGLRFSDGIRIHPSWLKGEMLLVRTQKTDDKLSIPLHPLLNDLLQKYAYNLQPLNISNQKFNKYVKVLCKEAGITEEVEIVKYEGKDKVYKVKIKHQLVGSHTGRRTFITNAIIAGVPLSVIQKITGHRRLTTLQTYVKISEEVGLGKMQLLSNHFN